MLFNHIFNYGGVSMKTLKIGALALCLFAAGSAIAMDENAVEAAREDVVRLTAQLQFAHLNPASRQKVNEAVNKADGFIINGSETDHNALRAIVTELQNFVVAEDNYKKTLVGKLRVSTELHPKKFIALGAITVVAAVYGIYKLVTKPKTKSIDVEETDLDEQELELV